MLPNKGQSPTKPGERNDMYWSPLTPESEEAYQRRMKKTEESSNTFTVDGVTYDADKYLKE
jgi:hypothetical protein